MSGMERCACCGEDYMSGDFDDESEHAPVRICDDCDAAECMANRHGDYDDCQRMDLDEESKFYPSDDEDDYEPESFGDNEP